MREFERPLAVFYFTYFVSAGAFFPFLSLFLEDRGLGPAAIGELLAITTVAKLIAPYLWGAWADARGERLTVVRFACIAATVAFVSMYWASGFWALAIVMLVYSFFWNACLPQVEALTLETLRQDTARYTRIRIWGSIGFIISVVGVGWWLERAPVAWLPLGVGAIMVMVSIVTWWLREAPSTDDRTMSGGSLKAVLFSPTVLVVFIACFLMQASHGAYYGFFALYLTEADYGEGWIGILWAIGVIAEVIVFWSMPQLLRRIGRAWLFVGCFALTTLRWCLLGWFVDSVPIVFFAQVLHAASYGVHHAVAILFVHRAFAGNLRGRGQALYSSLTYGAGTAAGTLASGYIWEAAGSHHAFTAAAIMSGLGFVLAWLLSAGSGHRWLLTSDGP
ncbi:MAG: MFS transporter [Pseudomonadota bacterium]